MSDHQIIIGQCVDFTLHAHNCGYAALPQIEGVTAALILNRFDWLEEMGITMGAAIELVPVRYLAITGAVERIVAEYVAASGRGRPKLVGVN
jgi:hypothetical protein